MSDDDAPDQVSRVFPGIRAVMAERRRRAEEAARQRQAATPPTIADRFRALYARHGAAVFLTSRVGPGGPIPDGYLERLAREFGAVHWKTAGAGLADRPGHGIWCLALSRTHAAGDDFAALASEAGAALVGTPAHRALGLLGPDPEACWFAHLAKLAGPPDADGFRHVHNAAEASILAAEAAWPEFPRAAGDDGGTGREDPPAPTAEAEGVPWELARDKALSHLKRNDWPGVRALAKIVGCSPATMHKAICGTPELLAKKRAAEAVNRSAPDTEMGPREAAAVESREADPATAAEERVDHLPPDALIEALVQQSRPRDRDEVRARLREMSPDRLREMAAEMAGDPDTPRRHR